MGAFYACFVKDLQALMMTMWGCGTMTVFTFILTLVELVLMCGLLAQKVSGKVAAIVLVTFTTYVVWTVPSC